MMPAEGVVKLMEELNELGVVCAKRLAYWTTDDHPDGSNLKVRMEEEMGDVYASLQFVTENLGLDRAAIESRGQGKYTLFVEWEADPGNGQEAYDRPKDS